MEYTHVELENMGTMKTTCHPTASQWQLSHGLQTELKVTTLSPGETHQAVQCNTSHSSAMETFFLDTAVVMHTRNYRVGEKTMSKGNETLTEVNWQLL